MQKLQVIKSDFIGVEKLHLEVASTLSIANCADCGQTSNLIHDDGDVQMIRNLSIAENRCYLGCIEPDGSTMSNVKTFVERVECKRSNAVTSSSMSVISTNVFAARASAR